MKLYDKELDLTGVTDWREAEERIARHIRILQERTEVKIAALERRIKELENE